MKRGACFVLLIVIALVVPVWRLPASVFFAALPDSVMSAAAPHISIHAITGTVWNGSAEFSLAPVPPRLRINWQCVPSVSPFGASCGLSDAVTGNAQLRALDQSVQLSQIKLAQPVRAMFNGIRVFDSELLSIAIDNATLSNAAAIVKGSAMSTNSQSRVGNAPLALGEVSIDCVPTANALTLSSICTLRNRAANQRIDGVIELRSNRVSGTITLPQTNGPTQTFTF